jgi:hypothetical protein
MNEQLALHPSSFRPHPLFGVRRLDAAMRIGDALEVREDFWARLQRAGSYTASGPDVSRLATFCSPLPRRQTNG